MKGNLWKVSDLLDETDIRFAQKRFFDLRSGYEYYGLTEKVLMRMAREAEHYTRFTPHIGSVEIYLKRI